MDNQTNIQPAGKLATNRGLGKYFWLSFVSFGVYALAFWSSLVSDVNIICHRYDGRKTMPYMTMLVLLSAVTLGIFPMVWYHKLSNRIGAELKRRECPYSFCARYYWLWNVLGSFIIVGPFIYMFKLCKAMNYLCEDYNEKG